MIYAVIDTNVLVSALLTSNPLSATKKVLDLLSSYKVTPLINDEVIAEYKDVLHRNKFPFKAEDVDNLISFIQQVGIDTNRTSFQESMPDEDDRVFFEITLTVEDSFLVTGNLKHYPKQPQVVTPAEFIELMGKYDQSTLLY